MKARVLKHRKQLVLAYRDEDGALVASPWSPKAERRLRKQGFDVEDLSKFYDFPGEYEQPRDCQREMVKYGLRYKRYFNLSEMRVGKTAATIWVIDLRMQYYGLEKVIIVAPLTTIDDTWRTELFGIIPHVPVYYGTKSNDHLVKAVQENKHDIYVINPAKLQKQYVIDALLKLNPGLIVVDEMMEFKASTTSQYEGLEQFFFPENGGKSRGFIPLSGTLGSQELTDVWTSARFINAETPSQFSHFKNKVMYQPEPKFERYRWDVREGAEEYVASLLQPSVRFRTDDINDMPKHEGMSVRAGMGAAQKRMFKEMKTEMITEDRGKVVTAANAAVKLWKLLQIASGVVYSEDSAPVLCGAPGKLKELSRLIRDTPHKTVIMSGWTCQQQYIMDHLSKDYKVDLINGKVKSRARKAAIDRFQEGDTDVLVCHPKTTKHGIKLHAGSLLIWFGPRTSTEEFVQGSARIRGPGTGKTVWCELSCTDLEEKWFDIVKNRKQTQERIVDLYREQLAL